VDQNGNPIPDKDAKRELPVVMFSGKFEGRKDEDLKEHSGVIVLDFDHIDVANSKNALATDEYILSCWVSPSGDGLKALVKIAQPRKHRDHFRAIASYMDRQYGLEVDSTGQNESRLCFESYDPEIIINEDSKVFTAVVSERTEVQSVSSQSQNTDYNKLAVLASMIRRAEDGQKHIELLKASNLAGGFITAGRVEEEEAKRVLIKEILKREVDSEENAIKTIEEGIERGKTMPVQDVVDSENRVKREMLINDGDMSFISDADSDFQWINKFASGEIPKGLDTGNARLDQYFRYKPEFVIINGHSNVGKTTMALYMMVNSSLRHDWRWIVYSSENKTAAIKMRLMEFVLNKPIDLMDREERKAAFNWVSYHFKVISNADVYSYMDLIIFAEKLIQYEGDYHGFFVDPYNSLKIHLNQGAAISTHEYHYEAASELLTFTNRHNMAMWLNAHSVTESQRRKGEDGLPIAPFAEDTEGGGKFVNRSDCFLTFHRRVQAQTSEDKRVMEFHVRKVRSQETGGEPTPFDDPFRFQMNVQRTGFNAMDTHGKLFEPLDLKKHQGFLDI
jgi:replicative DNA helicase